MIKLVPNKATFRKYLEENRKVDGKLLMI